MDHSGGGKCEEDPSTVLLDQELYRQLSPQQPGSLRRKRHPGSREGNGQDQCRDEPVNRYPPRLGSPVRPPPLRHRNHGPGAQPPHHRHADKDQQLAEPDGRHRRSTETPDEENVDGGHHPVEQVRHRDGQGEAQDLASHLPRSIVFPCVTPSSLASSLGVLGFLGFLEMNLINPINSPTMNPTNSINSKNLPPSQRGAAPSSFNG